VAQSDHISKARLDRSPTKCGFEEEELIEKMDPLMHLGQGITIYRNTVRSITWLFFFITMFLAIPIIVIYKNGEGIPKV